MARGTKTVCHVHPRRTPIGKALRKGHHRVGPRHYPVPDSQVKEGDFFFNVPLALITKVEMAEGSEQANSKMWVKWWEAAENFAQRNRSAAEIGSGPSAMMALPTPPDMRVRIRRFNEGGRVTPREF